MNLSIKEATSSDAQLLRDLGAQLFHEAYSDVKFDSNINEYIPKAFITEEIFQSIQNHTAQFFIAFDNDEPIGYLKLRWDRSHPNLTSTKNLEMERIYVARKHWRNKIGYELLKVAIDFGIKNKYTCLWLGVWQLNIRAIDFYKSNGFEIFGEKKFYVGSEENDDFVMRLKLISP